MRTPTVRATALTVALLCTTAVTTLGSASSASSADLDPTPAVSATAPSGFYTPPSELPADNGAIVRSEPMTFVVDPIFKNKVNADVRRIMYKSTSRGEDSMAVTGTVFVPRTAWKGPGPRPLVALAPGTQGLGDHCAPSIQGDAGTEYEVMMLTRFLARGYAVTMTDYEGLGTPGTHTYMMRETQAHAVLDSIRAAQELPEVDIPDAGPVALIGYSQGGGGAAAAAELASTYAPELNIVGAAVGAVPADLAAVAKNLDGKFYVGYELYAIRGMSQEYGLDLTPFLNDRGLQITQAIEGQCWIDSLSKYAGLKTSTLTNSGRPATDMMTEEPFASIIAEQRIGTIKPEMPTFVFHSLLDDVIPYTTGRAMARSWCRAGATVQMSDGFVFGHIQSWLLEFSGSAPAWIDQRFAGRAAPSNCRILR